LVAFSEVAEAAVPPWVNTGMDVCFLLRHLMDFQNFFLSLGFSPSKYFFFLHIAELESYLIPVFLMEDIITKASGLFVQVVSLAN